MKHSPESTERKKISITDLTCNYLENPIGVDTVSPSLSWVLNSTERDQLQTAFRVLVASSRELLDVDSGDMWDSGKVESSQSIHIPYEGTPLASRERYYWKVQVWDKNGYVSEWSEVAYWEMGILDESEWQAKWIGSPLTGESGQAPLFRRTVLIDKAIQSARIYICGLGYYELYINGKKIGDEVLAPAFTRYDETVLYQTHDVTEELAEGKNAIGVILGNGWYNCFTEEVWDFKQAPWRAMPKLLLQLHIKFSDGTETVVVSDGNWRTNTGPIIFNALRNGEFYDARLEREGWNLSDYDDSDWKDVIIVPGPGGVLRSQQMTPIKITKTIEPVSLTQVRPGVWVYDLGQNISGWAQLIVSGPKGTTITLKYAEKVGKDGDIDDSNIRTYVKSGEFQTDKFTLKGEGTEIWEPRFTYHGFQYVQVTGFPGTPTLENLRGRVVHTAFSRRGEFSCSNTLLNTMQRCSDWSTLGNYHGIPTDCPHREKNGWTGDAHLSAEQTLLNFDPATAYRKWMIDFRDVQRPSGQLPGIVPTGGWGYNWGSGPAWDSAAILIPWYLYVYCGDVEILKEHYDCMKKYVDFLGTMATEHIVTFGLGDWCPPVGDAGDHKCPTAVTSTAYYYVDTVILATVAKLLGKDADAAKYGELAKKIREAFRKEFMDTETGDVTGNCQTSVACAIYQGLVDSEETSRFASSLAGYVNEANNHIDCGILGTKYVMHALTQVGRADLAYEIATKTTFPSWGHWIEQGATTFWESWGGYASRNHHMFSDVSAWFYKGLAGINPDPENPGFKHIIIHPNIVGDLDWVDAWHRSMYGVIASSWKIEGNFLRMKVKIPANCTATVYLPTNSSENVRENGKPLAMQLGIRDIKTRDDRVVVTVGSGEYVFEMTYERL